MTRFIKVSGLDQPMVINVGHIVLMVPIVPPNNGQMTSIETSSAECYCRESIGDIVRAVQSQAPSESGVDVIDVTEWAKYHSK